MSFIKKIKASIQADPVIIRRDELVKAIDSMIARKKSNYSEPDNKIESYLGGKETYSYDGPLYSYLGRLEDNERMLKDIDRLEKLRVRLLEE